MDPSVQTFEFLIRNKLCVGRGFESLLLVRLLFGWGGTGRDRKSMQKPGTPFLDVNQALGHQSLQLLVVTARHHEEKPREGSEPPRRARFVHWPSNKCATLT